MSMSIYTAFKCQLGLGKDNAGGPPQRDSETGPSIQHDDYLATARDFNDGLFLAYGDQMTAARIRGVKLKKRDARRAFDRRGWLLGPPGWFHVQQVLLLLLVRTHWSFSPQKNADGQSKGKSKGRGKGKGKKQEKSTEQQPQTREHDMAHRNPSKQTLLHDIVFLDRYGINKDSVKYHQLQPLLTQGFRARVVALFYRSLRTDGVFERMRAARAQDPLEGSRQRYEREWDFFESAVRGMSAEEFDRHVRAVCDAALNRDAWKGKGIENHEFVNMCRYLQEVSLFLQLQHAVKFGDIGLLRRLISPLAVVFLGSGQSQYSYEMLHLRRMLHHSDAALQHAILAGGLVNESGKLDGFKALDLVLEHINLGFARDMKTKRTSTHDTISTFI